MIKRAVSQIILLSADKPTIFEKLVYFGSLIIRIGPIAYLLDGFNFWFQTNQQFSSFVLICLLANMIVGGIFHKKMHTFSWKEALKKNIGMWIILIIVYVLLEILRITVGDNVVGEGFKVLIQITTLMWPVSKALKNIYILSEKQFPPSFIMDRVYNFEKTGSVKDLFDTDLPTKKE